MDAPLVFANIGCSDNEPHIVNCPIATAEDQFDILYSIDYDFTYYERQGRTCNLEDAPFAYVACGTITDQGAWLVYGECFFYNACPVELNMGPRCMVFSWPISRL